MVVWKRNTASLAGTLGNITRGLVWRGYNASLAGTLGNITRGLVWRRNNASLAGTLENMYFEALFGGGIMLLWQEPLKIYTLRPCLEGE